MPRFAASASVVVKPDGGIRPSIVGEREAGVGERRARRLEHQLLGQAVGAAHVVRLGDADDRRARRRAH